METRGLRTTILIAALLIGCGKTSDPSTKLVGTWQQDSEHAFKEWAEGKTDELTGGVSVSAKLSDEEMAAVKEASDRSMLDTALTYQFNEDNTFTFTSGSIFAEKGHWEVIHEKGTEVTVRFEGGEGDPSDMTFVFLDDDTFEIKFEAELPFTMRFIRK